MKIALVFAVVALISHTTFLPLDEETTTACPGRGKDFNDPNGGSLECLKSEEECTEECEQRAAQLDGGGLLVYCKCPTSYYKARPCCQVAIAYLPTGGGPYASPFGLCAGLDPYSS